MQLITLVRLINCIIEYKDTDWIEVMILLLLFFCFLFFKELINGIFIISIIYSAVVKVGVQEL